MKSAAFDYIRPKSLAEASAALGRNDITTAAIAGGQSLLPMLSLRVAMIDLLVDIGRLDDLKALTKTPEGVRIGALTTHAAIEDGKVPDVFNGLMRRVAGQISYRAVRNHGTIGGSVALADPAADWPCCLIALDAKVQIAGRNGARSQPVADFIRGPYETALTPGDIVVGFDIPMPRARLRWGFAKVARKSGAFANSIAIVASQGRDSPVSVVIGAAGPRPCLLSAVAKQLRAATSSDEELRTAIAADLALHVPDADAYQKRMHAANILRAAREMRAQ
jgi:aerobic carbon-monoxide dehydrogenase medium subunit